MAFDLELGGKTAIITGASDGLGLATARRFVAEGANVVMTARRADHLAAAAKAVAAGGGGDAFPHVGDVTRAEDCEALVAAAAGRFGGVDILINNAGASAAFGLEALDDAAWEADFQLKVMAAAGGRIKLPKPEVVEHTREQFESGAAKAGAEVLLPEWPAYLRLVDREYPGWRT